jgi:NADPH-dependent 2,4-dienoyl-CoA reductase/sulfur reductase-like enzyme
MESVVIAGASIAGLSAARELRRGGYEGSLRLVDAEPDAGYRRPAVSKGILTGEDAPDGVRLPGLGDLGVEVLGGVRLHGLDLGSRVIVGDGPDGAPLVLPFDGAVLATGSVARRTPLGAALDGVFSLRGMGDALRLREALLAARRLVVVGAGFIGLEVAASAHKLGLEVTVIEAAPKPLAHVLGDELAARMAALHAQRGVEIICGVSVAEVEGAGTVEVVELSDGRRLEADVLLVAVGSQPAVGWLADSGLDAGAHGVNCDATCAATSAEGVVAAGDIASWENPLYGRRMRIEHWTNAQEQGSYAARRLLGTHDPAGFASAPYFWSDQYDSKLSSIGSAVGHDEARVIVDDDGAIAVAYGHEGTLIAVAGIDVGPLVPRARRLVEGREPLDALAGLLKVG